MADQKREIDRNDLLQLFVYALFMLSTLSLLVVLATDGSAWLAPLVGVAVTIGPSVMFWIRASERKENQTVVRGAQQTRSTKPQFDFTENDDDPTQPPTPTPRKAIENS